MDRLCPGGALSSASSACGDLLQRSEFQQRLQSSGPLQLSVLDSGESAAMTGAMIEPTPIGPIQSIQVVPETTLADTDGLLSMIKRNPSLQQDDGDSFLACLGPTGNALPSQTQYAAGPGNPPSISARSLEDLWQLTQDLPLQAPQQSKTFGVPTEFQQPAIDISIAPAIGERKVGAILLQSTQDSLQPQKQWQQRPHGIAATKMQSELLEESLLSRSVCRGLESLVQFTRADSLQQQRQAANSVTCRKPAKHPQLPSAVSSFPEPSMGPSINANALEELWQQTQQQQLASPSSNRFEDLMRDKCQGQQKRDKPQQDKLAPMVVAALPTNALQNQIASLPSIKGDKDIEDQIASQAVLGPIEVSSSDTADISSSTATTSTKCKSMETPLSNTEICTLKDSVSKVRFRASHLEQWNQRFNELVRYRLQNGNCLVPLEYVPNPRLSFWVKRQRCQYKLKMEGKHSTLTPDRKKALDELGFVWDSHLATWEEKFNELLQFRSAHGHCNVNRNDDYNLSIWVKSQKRQMKLYHSEAAAAAVALVTKKQPVGTVGSKKKCNLTSDMVERLMGIGLLSRASSRTFSPVSGNKTTKRT